MTLVDDCEFASFWHGRLNPFAYACLSSFPQAGVSLRVFTYDPHLELPPGVRHADARTICPDKSLTRKFIANGKPSLAHLCGYVSLSDDPADGLLLGRHRHALLEQAGL